MAITKVTSGVRDIATGEVVAGDLASTLDLSGKTVTLAAGAVTAHVTQYDDNQLKEDIALTAFHAATAGSLAKYDLIDQTIDSFSDTSGIDLSASTYEGHDTTSKYMSGSVPGGDGTTGGTSWDETIGGTDYRLKKFTVVGNTTFTVPASGDATVLIVAGGGGAGASNGASGPGGAGGLLYDATVTISGSNTITVGAAGAGSSSGGSNGGAGGNSVAFGGTATGGGGGSGAHSPGGSGSAGGSGGGGTYGSGAGGAGNQGDSGGFTGFGYAGGTGGNQDGAHGTGGGGGAGGPGGNGSTSAGGAGGGGRDYTSTFGTTVGESGYFASGGGGGAQNTSYTAGSSPQGGGGNGDNDSLGDDGLANTGGGAGGANPQNSGADGGSGVVIVRWPATQWPGTVAQNMTLISNATTAEAQPTKADLVMTISNGAGTATIGTDVIAYVSRDNGTTYTSFGLSSSSDQGTTGGHTILTAHDLDISGQPAGSAMRYKITTHNQSEGSKETRINAVSLGWS